MHRDAPRQILKTRWFSRAARKAKIDDAELRAAVSAAALGQADDLGGGVFKKRLDRNQHRSIAASFLRRPTASGGLPISLRKKDRANIEDDELEAFRQLAALYAAKSQAAIQRELEAGELTEIGSDEPENLRE